MVNKEISNSLNEKHLKSIYPNTKICEKCKETRTKTCIHRYEVREKVNLLVKRERERGNNKGNIREVSIFFMANIKFLHLSSLR